MTKRNEELRSRIKSIEMICHAALVGQPDDDEACRRHLEEYTRRIRSAVMADSKEEVQHDRQGEGGNNVGV